MLSLTDEGSRLCDGLRRREVLRIGGLGALGGLSLPGLLASQLQAKPLGVSNSFGRAKSCIVLFLMGGPPQHSTWDPKPDAPAEVRGEFGPIATNVPGIFLSELMPHTAKVADKLCILRAMSTDDNAHSSSGYYMLTGRPHSPMNFENGNPGPPNDVPSLGGVMSRLAPSKGGLPSTVTLPHRIFNTDGSVWPGQDAGRLGRGADPWLLNAKMTPQGYHVDEISLPADLDPKRLAGRRGLLDELRRNLDRSSADSVSKVLEQRTGQAFDVLLSSRARDAFHLDREPEPSRKRYGESPFGQSVLLARRLVEAGVQLVQVNWYRGPDEPPSNPCWDSHTGEAARLKTVLVPPMDQAYGTLLADLDERGMLDETLVVCMSEFGRSPKLDANGGRGHWGHVFSVSLAGGGIRGGLVYGSSDKMAAHPREGLVRPEDLSATIYHCLGYTPETEYLDMLGRPHAISRGQVLRDVCV